MAEDTLHRLRIISVGLEALSAEMLLIGLARQERPSGHCRESGIGALRDNPLYGASRVF